MAISFSDKNRSGKIHPVKTTTANGKFIDQPAPSLLLLVIVCAVLLLALLAIPLGVFLIGKIPILGPVLIICFAVLALLYAILTLFALGSTRYCLDQTGISIRFGIWHQFFPWQEFSGYALQPKNFVTKVNSTGTTPCVRLNNALVLKRTNGKLLYLTPQSPTKILSTIKDFIPSL